MRSSPSTSWPAMRIFSCPFTGSFGLLTCSAIDGSIPPARSSSLVPSLWIDAQLCEDLGNGRQGIAHVLSGQSAYAADAEALRYSKLARINDVAALLQLVIETLEHEFCILRHMECD